MKFANHIMSNPSSSNSSPNNNIRKMPVKDCRSASPSHLVECDGDTYSTCQCQECTKDHWKFSTLQESLTETEDEISPSSSQEVSKPFMSLSSLGNFFKERPGSLAKSKKKDKVKGSRLSSHSFHAPSVKNSHFFVSTPLTCVPLGAYILAEKEPSLSRSLSLRLDNKLCCAKDTKKLLNVHEKPPSGVVSGSRSLEALVVDGSDPRKPRGISLRRLARSRNSSETGATSDSNTGHSDNEFPKSTGPSIRVGSEGSFPTGTPAESSRVGAWAASFEKLLDDPAGLHTFAEFLKKEYSHENIYFWTACERYKCISNDEERREVAKNIFERHLGSSASEPVNVDSHARQKAQEGLAASPNESLFLAAQKQIFNLMKFDSYSRFLKSDLYNSCLSHERKGLPLPYSGDVSLDPDFESKESQYSKLLKKSKSDVDDRRRKSLLPWHRKDRSKSKDRGETEFGGLRKKNNRTQSESSSSRFELFGSRTSLASSDRVMSKESLTSCEAASLSSSDGASLCRFILPDRSNSVLVVRSGETIRELVRQLLDKRRIRFTDYNVVFTKNNKLVDLNKESTVLGGQEVRVERMVLFGLHLPSRKTVIVKAKPHKIVGDVLKPILSKYGLKLDLMFIHKMGDDKSVNLKATVTELDGQKFMVQTKEAVKEWSDPGRISRSNNVLDEITNRVFEDLLRGKEQNAFDDLGVLDFDSRSTKTEPTSESSSSVLGMESSRRESLSIDRNSLFFGRGLKSDDLPTKKNQNFVSQPKPKTDSTHHQDDTDLYEGLKRAQLFRLDDQRGTEINIELPDFLKADRKENLSASLAPSALMNGNLSSKAHPEIWGGAQDSPSTTTGGDDTLVASPEGVDSEEGESGVDEGRRTPNTHQLKNNQARQSQWSIGSSGQVNSAFKEDPKKVSENVFENTKNLDTFKQIEIEGSLTAVLTPPPPLPPKPTMGGIKRGPPPRPPSRPPPHSLVRSIQFHDSHSRINENAVLADKFSVSFV